MTPKKREAIEYILGQIENGYVDLGLDDQDSFEVIKEGISILQAKDNQNSQNAEIKKLKAIIKKIEILCHTFGTCEKLFTDITAKFAFLKIANYLKESLDIYNTEDKIE